MPENDDILQPNAAQAMAMGAIPVHAATLNITWDSQQGELPDPVPYDASEADLKAMATEAVSGGSVPGIDADADVDFDGYVIKRYDAKGDLPNRVVLRPKTPFGA